MEWLTGLLSNPTMLIMLVVVGLMLFTGGGSGGHGGLQWLKFHRPARFKSPETVTQIRRFCNLFQKRNFIARANAAHLGRDR